MTYSSSIEQMFLRFNTMLSQRSSYVPEIENNDNTCSDEGYSSDNLPLSTQTELTPVSDWIRECRMELMKKSSNTWQFDFENEKPLVELAAVPSWPSNWEWELIDHDFSYGNKMKNCS